VPKFREERKSFCHAFTTFLLEFPFSKWGLDFIVPINPESQARLVFILKTIDYFMKWAEVVPLKHSQDEQLISFLETNIFPYFIFLWKLLHTTIPLLFQLR
jgi:hypothetical protein